MILPLMEGFLAFALTLLALATVTSILVETWNRIVAQRGRVLYGMLEHFLVHDFVKILQRLLPGQLPPELAQLHLAATAPAQAQVALAPQAAVSDEAARAYLKRFIEQLRDELLFKPSSVGQGSLGQIWACIHRWTDRYIAWLYRHIAVVELPTDELLRRFWRTELGRNIEANAAAQKDAFDKALKDAYDELGASANNWFAGRAKTLAMIFGLILAVAVNIDGVRILGMYLNNDSARNAVIAKASTIVSDYEKTSAAGAAGANAVTASGNQPASGVNPAQPLSEQAKQDFQLAKDARDKAQATLSLLQGLGVPIGYAEFPYCQRTDADSRCGEIWQAISRSPPETDAAWRPLIAACQPVGWLEHIWKWLTVEPSDLKQQDANRDNACTKASAVCFAVGPAAPASSDKNSCIASLRSLKVANLFDHTDLLFWVLRILGTGLLIGLGGPFWYDMVQKLLSVVTKK